jgi:hypothetical protein
VTRAASYPNTLTLLIKEISMNNRILTVVATVSLLCLMSGCRVVRNFCFGHGARCGAPAPNYLQPGPRHAPAAAPPCQCVPSPAVAPAPYASEPVCGIESYGGVINDPYLSGEVIGEGVYVDGQYPAGATIMSDGFVPRVPQNYGVNKFDTDGARIINELPPGVKASN